MSDAKKLNIIIQTLFVGIPTSETIAFNEALGDPKLKPKKAPEIFAAVHAALNKAIEVTSENNICSYPQPISEPRTIPCSMCGGAGTILIRFGKFVPKKSERCPKCHGSGIDRQ